jgi:D-aspartate ligase
MKPGAIIIEGHVQGLSNTRALGAAGIPVVVVDTVNCIARYSRYCKGFFRCPAFDSDDLADFLIALGRNHGLTGWLLLPSNDHAVHTISRNKARLETIFKVITPGPDIINDIYDKARLVAKAEQAGVPVPGTVYPDTASPGSVSLRFPVLTRGRFGLDFYKAVGAKAFPAGDLKEFRKHLARIDATYPVGNTLTQELIPDDGTNPTLSYAALCVDGQIKAFWMGEKLRQHPLRFGTATFAKSMYVKVCHDQSVRLLKALNYTGVCEVEYLKDPRDGEYKLIEINARTWLWVGLARACGVDFARLAYDHVNGRPTRMPAPGEYDIGVCWVNPWTDLPYSLAAICRGNLRLVDYINSLRKNRLVSLYDWQDPYPFFMYLFLTLLYLKER